MARRKTRHAKVRRTICWLALGAVISVPGAAPLIAQSAPLPGVTTAPGFRGAATPTLRVPDAALGSWQVVLDAPTYKLKTNYNVEVKIGGFRPGMPEAVLSYFAGNAQRPSTICRSQLTLIGVEGQELIFAESLNHKGGKDPCPVRAQIAITPQPGQLVALVHSCDMRTQVFGDRYKRSDIGIDIEAIRPQNFQLIFDAAG